MYSPAYVTLHGKGELRERALHLYRMMEKCCLCPRECGVNRLKGEKGYCGAGSDLVVSGAFPHFGEEAPLVGHGGSGTIFFSHCNLLCIFCQNHEISHLGEGRSATGRELATMMISLQRMGCHNINLVTPTHFTAQIVDGLDLAAEMGLSIPLVYNCGGYESLSVLRLLEGVVDIYMPDAKFSEPAVSGSLCSADDYFDVCRIALAEMHRQVGTLEMDDNGVATQGLLVRHLVLPDQLAGTGRLVAFIAGELSAESYVNVMRQYHPCFRARKHPSLDRRITVKEYTDAVAMAVEAGLHRGF